MAKSGDGDRAATSGDAPTSSAAVRPKLPPPPDVGTSESARERTVVTRLPPRAAAPSDPKELLPTLRMPPVEARAVRREAEDLAARLGIGGAKRTAKAESGANGSATQSDAPIAAEREASASAASPSVASPSEAPPLAASEVAKPADEVTKRSAPPIDPRELVPTMQLPAVAPLPEHRERSAHPQARRPPLPLPSVLRAGPRTMGGPRMPPPADTLVATSSERSGPRPGSPEPMPVIDTATLVADVAEQLYEAEAAEEAARVAEAAAARAAEAATSDPADLDAPAILEQVHPAPTPAIPRIPTMVAEPIEESIASDPPPRKLGWIAAIAAVVVATIGLASYGWSSDAKEVEPAARNEAALSSPRAGEPSHAAALPTKPPTSAPAIAMAPSPPPAPAVDPPPVDPIVEPPPIEPVPVATPLPEAVPTPPAPPLEIEDDEAPVAAPAPTPAPASAAKKPSPPPKHAKNTKRASKSAPKKSPASPPPPAAKQASSAPAPAAKQDAASLLKEAEAAYGKGSWGSALRSAQKSNGMRSDPRALKIIALAACRLGKESTAQNAFDRLPLGMRKSVRTTCRDVGIRLQL